MAINPKILKYSFSIQEESFYIPALLLGISSLIGFILKINIKNLIYLNLTFALIVLIREAGIVEVERDREIWCSVVYLICVVGRLRAAERWIDRVKPRVVIR